MREKNYTSFQIADVGRLLQKKFQKNGDTQFDLRVVDAFVELLREDVVSFNRIRNEHPPRFTVSETSVENMKHVCPDIVT